jgi:hypothetical protein
MSRSFAKVLATVFIFNLVCLVGSPRGGVARAADEGKCTIAVKGDTPSAKACASGGRAAAKKLMKDMVKKAKAGGQKFTCEGCHKDLDNYELTKNANADYKKLEEASGIK